MKTALLSLATVVFSLVFWSSWALAQEKPGDAPFAYAAPAFIKELDTRYPAQPPVPPSPPATAGSFTSPRSSAPSTRRSATARSSPSSGTR